MNERIGNISYYDSKQSEYNFNKPYSEDTAKAIDEEVKKIIESAYQRTIKLLTEKKEQLEILAKELLEKEVLFQYDLEGLIGKRPFDNQTTYEAFTNNKNGQVKAEQVVEAEAEVVEDAVAADKTEDTTSEDSEETKSTDKSE